MELHIKIDYSDVQGPKQNLKVCPKKWKLASLKMLICKKIARRTGGYGGHPLSHIHTQYANVELLDLDSMTKWDKCQVDYESFSPCFRR
ncbi:unnamed protein product [Ilex paraguariensis]|uniref:Uncharacterized protein n=1 Tax=Ilex paraguariensis TaxID=185542 RepID=A0ABC8RWQ0_9AQUA